jgi:ribulose-phosphate 3-epimerase
MVLVMTVNPGYSGQSYTTGSETKVLKTRNLLDASDHFIHLEVDGGINTKTLPLVLAAGANVFVAASAIFHHPEGIMEGVRDLRTVIDG